MQKLEQFDVAIVACFVGMVRAETAKEDPYKDPRHVFKWTVTITYQGRSYTGDYRAGVAHCTMDVREWRKGVAAHYGSNGPECIHVPVTYEIARVFKPFGALSVSEIEGIVYPTPPTAAGYLSCLQLDARCGEHLLFEDFCAEFGDDPDSRRAERTWRACQETRGHMQKLFGADFEAFMAAESE